MKKSKYLIGCLIGILLGVLLLVSTLAYGVAFPLFLTFLILKLCGVIAWSWFLVWLPLIIGGVGLVIAIIIRILVKD